QPDLERLLDLRARSLPTVEVRRGREIVGIEPEGDGVTLAVAGGGDARARFVVGCDGANSFVRAHLGASVTDLGFFFDWLLVDGDAAHQMPPFAGQGMCSGLRDAANLAWKLGLVLDGRAPDALLDTYPSERIPHVRSVIDFSMALGRVICIADPEEAATRDA